MVRDIDLMRKILIVIERDYQPGKGNMPGPSIDGYDRSTVAEHCDLLEQDGLIKEYKASYADDAIYAFWIGNLTTRGYDYLELIRNDDVWEKTKAELDAKPHPKVVDEIARIAGIFSGRFFKEIND
jgi:hypothetical protein